MGYCYTRSGALCCDKCGGSAATGTPARKRTCTARVEYPQDGANARSIPYCPPPALCDGCWRELGMSKGLHSDCKEPAQRMTEENRAIAAKIAAGDLQVMSGFGSWHETVPEGMTGVFFAGNRTDQWANGRWCLIPAHEYEPGTKKFLSDYPNAVEWKANPDRLRYLIEHPEALEDAASPA